MYWYGIIYEDLETGNQEVFWWINKPFSKKRKPLLGYKEIGIAKVREKKLEDD